MGVAVAREEPIDRSALVSGAMKISDRLMTLLPRKVYAYPRVLNCTLQRVPERMLLQAHAYKWRISHPQSYFYLVRTQPHCVFQPRAVKLLHNVLPIYSHGSRHSHFGANFRSRVAIVSLLNPLPDGCPRYVFNPVYHNDFLSLQ